MESLRVELRVLQAQGFRLSLICKEARISRGMMSLFISGKRNFSEKTMDKIDKALDEILGSRR